MLNEEFILKMIKPYLNSKRELSEFEFFELFYGLERKEQYEVINIMIKNDIDFVDVKEDEASSLEKVEVLQQKRDDADYKNLLHIKNEQLCLMYQNGDLSALEALIEKNKRFVYQLALKLHSQYRQDSLTVEDLYQEGNLGLIKAAQRFDFAFDNQFITYCWHWVRQAITRAAIDTGFMVRLPVHLLEKISHINACRRAHPLANSEELLAILNSEKSASTPITLEKLIEYMRYADLYTNTTSLNTLVGDDEGSELIEFIPDESCSIEDRIFENNLRESIIAELSTLTAREETVIRLRFGSNGDTPMTLGEVGKHLNVTRERVRQIEASALQKLRQPMRRKNLRVYLEDRQ